MVNLNPLSNRGSHRQQSERTLVDPRDAEKTAKGQGEYEDTPIKLLRPRILLMGLVVSLGGLIFGFDTGQISGFVEMQNFLGLFGDSPPGQGFSNVREGTIVGLVC